MKQISDEEIYELREKKMTYKEISEYFAKKRKKISPSQLCNRCKKIYAKKGKKEPKVKRKNKRINKRINGISDEEIYELREQKMTYKEISEFFAKKRKKISPSQLCRRCKKIYAKKGKKEPKVKRKINKRINGATDEEIYELREQKMTYKEISEFFAKKRIQISNTTIDGRCKKIYKEKGKEEPKVKRINKRINGATDEEIYELREQRNTYEEIAKYFKDKGIQISRSTIDIRCKKIYKEKGKEEPRGIRRRKTTPKDNSLENLNKTLDEKITQKIKTEKELAELKDREASDKKGAEK